MPSPLDFDDLKAASVYFEILGCNPHDLQPVSRKIQFEQNPDGTVVYYRITANGSYVRADGTRGEFVKMTTDDGRDVFLHYSQVFGPTVQARKRMGTLAYILGVTYQNAYRQMAMLNDLINEAAALNEAMRNLNDVFYSFAANAANYDSSFVNQMLPIDPALLRRYANNGLQFPLNRVCGGMVPKLYVSVTISSVPGGTDAMLDYYSWGIFFVANDESHKYLWSADPSGASDITPPTHTLTECIRHPEIASIIGDPEKTSLQFSTAKKHKLIASSEYYGECFFDASGNMGYKHFLGFSGDTSKIDFWRPQENAKNRNCNDEKEVDISAPGYSHDVSLDDMLSGDKIAYFNRNEANAFLDRIRIAIDQLNNELSGISTMINVDNQDLQQNYTVATATLEASEEAKQKTTRNIR
jgi:hypothetical protein